MEVRSVSMANVGNATKLGECEEPKQVQASLLKQDEPCDCVSFKSRSAEMSDTEKKELILKARTKASGWAIFGGVFSTLYYAFRSNNTVAEKYGLDVKEDKELVDKIKNEQIKATIPAAVIDTAGYALLGLGTILGTLLASIPYFYNKRSSAEDIKL